MNIACTVRRSFPGPGGIATMMRVVTTELSRGHRVRVWAARIDAAPFTRLNTTLLAQRFAPLSVDGVEVSPVPMGPVATAATAPVVLMRVPGLRRFVYKAIRRATAASYARALAPALARDWGSPDVVHAWGGEHLNWAAGRAARARGIPLVVTPFAHPGAWGDDPINVRFYQSAQAVLALLPSEAAFYSRLGVDPARLRVVGVPVTPLPEAGPYVRARHGLGADPLVLYVGVKEPYKGYRTLLEAVAIVRREVPRARFAFVGPRTPASEADFASAPEGVIEVGLVSDEEIGAWHRAATVFCLPSTSEIMPVAILEAWQAGKPVVAARWWCAHDLIEHGRDGVVVDASAEAVAGGVVALLRDQDGARAMGEAGRAKVLERYTPAAVAARHEEAYEGARSLR